MQRSSKNAKESYNFTGGRRRENWEHGEVEAGFSKNKENTKAVKRGNIKTVCTAFSTTIARTRLQAPQTLPGKLVQGRGAERWPPGIRGFLAGKHLGPCSRVPLAQWLEQWSYEP